MHDSSGNPVAYPLRSLRPPLRSELIWAKTGGPGQWLPLPQHMLDTYHIAKYLYDDWLSRSVKARWATGALDPDDMKTVVLFLAAAHDVGKAAPAFIAQHEPLAQWVRDVGLKCAHMDELREDRRALPHSLIGEYETYLWLQQRGVPRRTARSLASVIGGHHGKPIPQSALREGSRRPSGMGESEWQEVRRGLLDWVSALSGFSSLLDLGVDLSLTLPVLVEITGFVIVADWLASNTSLFPLFPRDPGRGLVENMETRAAFGWDEIAMPAPWHPQPVPLAVDTVFRDRFGWPDTAMPHPTQAAAFRLAQDVDVGLMCIETETGGGKTEAALVAAEVIAAKLGAQGLLIALPTQATTNAMFTRVASWIDRLPQPPREVAAWSLTLGHGKALLNKDFVRLKDEFTEFQRTLASVSDFATIFEDGNEQFPPDLCNAVVHQWFLSSKRRLLANFAVVTIDQLLMAALQRKHLMLAHVALSGKVVVVDEAHASDDYMNVYLDSVLSWLGAYRAPVIVLSATLTPERRKSMMRAYASHRATEIDELAFDTDEYPLVTVVPADESPIVKEVICKSKADRTVSCHWMNPELDLVTRAVSESISDGGAALVVRNTVSDAQETARALADMGLEVLLNHAGFLAADRANNDAELISLFGKDGQRPERIVVVATQVVEQSLDIDFDILFTDLAPVDLLLQRVGRLHRHGSAHPRPAALEDARLVILANTDDPSAAPIPTPGSRVVYGDHYLNRTSAALQDLGHTIRIPSDVSPLVSAALGTEPIGPSAWTAQMTKAAEEHAKKIESQRLKATTWCVRPWKGEHDDRHGLGQWMATSSDYEEIQMGAAVRDTEPSIEVIVVPLTPNGEAAVKPPWMGEPKEVAEILDTSTLPTDDLAREIASWSVRLPARLCRWGMDEDTIKSIDSDERTRRWMWRRHPILKGELLLAMTLEREGGPDLLTELTIRDKAYRLRYSPAQGLEVTET